MFGAAGHELDLLALADRAFDHADEDNHAEVGIVPAIDQHGLERGIGIALGRGDAGDDGFEHVLDPDARLGRGEDGVGGIEADHFLDLVLDLFGLGGGQVDLVDDGDDLVVVLDRLVDVGEGLRLDPLRGVNDEERAFAGGQAARHFIGEVDVAGGVHEVELIVLAVLGAVLQPDGLGLDRDPAFALNVHVIKDLRRHLTLGQAPGELDQPIRQGALAVVDMSDNAEISDTCKICHDTSGNFVPPLAASQRTVTGPEGHKTIGYQRFSMTNKAVANLSRLLGRSGTAMWARSRRPECSPLGLNGQRRRISQTLSMARKFRNFARGRCQKFAGQHCGRAGSRTLEERIDDWKERCEHSSRLLCRKMCRAAWAWGSAPWRANIGSRRRRVS